MSPEAVARGFSGPRETYGFIEFLPGDLYRYDLGLLELIFTIIVAGLLALTWHKKIPTGSYIAATSLTYAPVRFAMDFLRITDGEVADPRYAGLTPAQWECSALFLWGVYVLIRMRANARRGFDPASLALDPRVSSESLQKNELVPT